MFFLEAQTKIKMFFPNIFTEIFHVALTLVFICCTIAGQCRL